MKDNEQRDWKLPTFGDLCPSAIDWARMAAYIDGEGSILINTQKRGSMEAVGFYLRVMVANTDVRLMVWLKETFGGSYVDANTEKYYEGKNWKRSYHWGTSAGRAAWVLHNCLPYFIMKREQAELGIQLKESMDSFACARRKHLPKDVMEHRRELKRKLLVMKAKGKVMEPAQAARIMEVS